MRHHRAKMSSFPANLPATLVVVATGEAACGNGDYPEVRVSFRQGQSAGRR
jgi:hypothetical protein